jgi:hypothetical protein
MHFPWHCRGKELSLLLHAKLELLKSNLVAIGCRSGAVPKDGMVNTENMDIYTPICGDAKDPISHIWCMDSVDARPRWLTQRRAKVRVLFRPHKYPQPWGYFVCWG